MFIFQRNSSGHRLLCALQNSNNGILGTRKLRKFDTLEDTLYIMTALKYKMQKSLMKVRRLLPSMKSIHHSYTCPLIAPLEFSRTQIQQ